MQFNIISHNTTPYIEMDPSNETHSQQQLNISEKTHNKREWNEVATLVDAQSEPLKKKIKTVHFNEEPEILIYNKYDAPIKIDNRYDGVKNNQEFHEAICISEIELEAIKGTIKKKNIVQPREINKAIRIYKSSTNKLGCLKELENIIFPVLSSESKVDQTLSLAFYTLATGYEKILSGNNENTSERQIFKDKVIYYYEKTLQFCSDDDASDIYYAFAQLYRQENDHQNYYNMLVNCSNSKEGWIAYDELGHCYLRGKAVEKSEEKALEYFLKGTEHHDEDAYYSLALFYNSRRKNAKTDAARELNTNLAMKAFKALSQGKNVTKDLNKFSKFSYQFLKDLNGKNEFKPRDIEKSEKAYKEILKKDKENFGAINLLGLLTFLRKEDPRDRRPQAIAIDSLAIEYLEKAKKQGSNVAADILIEKPMIYRNISVFLSKPDYIYEEISYHLNRFV